jgi:hypothetical protein
MTVFRCFAFANMLLALLFSACTRDEAPTFSGFGKKPVYVPISELDNISNLPPQTVQQSGTIFLKDTLFLMLEQRKGIHVFSINDPAEPTALTFLKIPAISDFTVSGNRLYADSWRDLVTIDISNIMAIQSIDRQTNVFSPLLYPLFFNGIFECVDESKGAVVDWINAELPEARCITNN